MPLANYRAYNVSNCNLFDALGETVARPFGDLGDCSNSRPCPIPAAAADTTFPAIPATVPPRATITFSASTAPTTTFQAVHVGSPASTSNQAATSSTTTTTATTTAASRPTSSTTGSNAKRQSFSL